MSAAKITEFRLGKGRTSRPTETEEWTKKYLEFAVRMPDQYTEKDLQEAMLRTEYLVDNWLGAPEVPHIPEFDTGLLMNHAWKGKKLGDNQYEKGSVAWGWDFNDQFPDSVINVLKKGPLTIDKYEFTLLDVIIQAKEKKEAKKRRT
jgi:hypothetical protein